MNPSVAVGIPTVVGCLMLLVTCSNSLGGYGIIKWTWHPVLMLIGMCAMSVGIVTRSANLSTGWRLHGIIQGLACVAMLAGYAAAYYVHELGGKEHIPWKKNWIRIAHVLAGLCVLILVLTQCIVGAMQYFRSTRRLIYGTPAGLQLRRVHTDHGVTLWAAGMLVMCGGVYIMLVEGTQSWGMCAFSVLVLASLMAFICVVQKQGGSTRPHAFQPLDQHPGTSSIGGGAGLQQAGAAEADAGNLESDRTPLSPGYSDLPSREGVAYEATAAAFETKYSGESTPATAAAAAGQSAHSPGAVSNASGAASVSSRGNGRQRTGRQGACAVSPPTSEAS